MNFAPKEEISGLLGQSAGSLGGGLQRLAEAKMQHLEQAYQRKQQLKEMFENQQIQQAQKAGIKKLYSQGGHVTDADAEYLADIHQKDPAAAAKVYEFLGKLKAQPGETRQPFAIQDTNAEQIARQGMQNKNATELAKIGLGEKELAYKTGYDEKAFAMKDKELSQKQAKEEQMLKHIAFKEGMDQKNYELKARELAQSHKLEREKLELDKQKAKEMGGGRLNPQNQIKVINANKAFNQHIDKQLENSNEVIDLSQRAIDLINSGKTREGWSGMLPLALTRANPETRELSTLLEEIAAKKAMVGGGALSNAKIAFGKSQKASLDMPKKAQLKVLEEGIKRHRLMGPALQDIREQIIEENGNEEPVGLQSKVMARWQELLDSPEKEHPAAEYEEGATATEKGKSYIVKNGRWQRLEKKAGSK